MKHRIQLEPSNISFDSYFNILDDALEQGFVLEHGCKTGDCGACSAQVLSGLVENENGQTVIQGSVLTCQSKALSDVVLKANYYPELAHVKTQTVPCKVAKVQYLTDDILSLTFRLPPTAQFEYLAGQYVDLSFQGVKRSYSIANASSALKQIELHIRKVPDGAMSHLLFGSVADNQLMRMEGPKGTFFVRDGDKPLLFIATGTGIAPVKAMVEQLISTDDQREVHIYWGMQFQSEIYCQELMSYSQQHANIHFTSVLSQESHPQSEFGYVQDIVIKNVAGLEFYEVYACGSVKMIDAAKALFIEHGLPSEAFFSDAFTPAK